MSILRFSVAEHFADADAFFENISKTCENTSFRPETHTIPWQIMWSYLQRALIGNEPFAVSEVGSTWVGSFEEIHALSDFDPVDIAELGGPERFVPSAWKSAFSADDQRVLSIPWMVDTRVIFYWKDILESAGIDDSTAFTTPAQMDETLAKLKAASKPTLAVPTFAVTNTVHQIASWLWSTGHDFLNADASASELTDETAVEGIVAYFELSRYLTRKYDSLDSVLEAFQTKKAAVMMSGPWFLRHLELRGAGEKYLRNLGVALPPGPPFVGGSNLVVWRQPDGRERTPEAMDWVRHLTSAETQQRVCEATGLLPAVQELLNDRSAADDPFRSVFAQALTKGRPMPRAAFWGAVEAELVRVFGNIWSVLKEDPRYTVHSAVISQLAPAAKVIDEKLYRHSRSPRPPA